MTKKIVTIIGARPQFVKASAVSRLIEVNPKLTEVMVHTGQHYDQNMSQIFFDELEMNKPAYNLEIGSGLHGAQTARMLTDIESVLLKEKPDMVLVYGDTNSTLAGALSASKLHIPVAHVEAGLRSFNRKMPEEINRIVADQLSDYLFTPTETASNNLKNEGYSSKRVHQVGDVMYDATLYYSEKAEKHNRLLEKLGVQGGSYLLATIHRAENTDDKERLDNIFEGLIKLSNILPIIMPLHPRTTKVLRDGKLYEKVEKCIQFIPPVGFLDMLLLEKNAKLIVTDSGGVQKEAYFQSIPCVTLRDETEWTELVKLGWNKLVSPTSPEIIENEVISFLDARGESSAQPYGGGNAAEKIVETLL